MTKRIHAMSPSEIQALSKPQREQQFKEAVVYAIGQSIQFGNTEVATKLLARLSRVTCKPTASAALVRYFEKFGNLAFSKATGTMCFRNARPPESWTTEYKAALLCADLDKILSDAPMKHAVLDVDKELRALLTRLKKTKDDPDRVVLHDILISKVEDVILAYGRTDAKLEEEKRGRALFDRSTQMSTMRASKLAKGA